MLTADTITDEQIRELRAKELYTPTTSFPDSYLIDECDAALGLPSRYSQPAMQCTPSASKIARARARCAEILNARTAKGDK